MEYQDYLQHWNYFCSLAARLEGTKDYVYHGFSGNGPGNAKMIHGEVYSDIFKQIIILAASEFEILAKALCKEKGERAKNIKDISRILLQHFPELPKTEIMTTFCTCIPLEDWKYDGEKVNGLEWWNAYNALKHNEVRSYQKATLANAYLSVASLYILILYYMYVTFGSLKIPSILPPAYFKSKYTVEAFATNGGLLPDWGNKSPAEVLKEKYPSYYTT